MPHRRGILNYPPSFPLKIVSLLLLSSLAGRFAHAEEKVGRIRSLAEIRHEHVVMQKWDLSCGAAALATLLTYDLNDPVTEREVATAMLHKSDPIRVKARGGFSLLNMQEYAQARGYQADGYGEVSLEDLSKMLPAIVPVQFHGYDHFIVVRKIGGGTVSFADPAYGLRTASIPAFQQAWNNQIAFSVLAK
jgi:uncharacterized protein